MVKPLLAAALLTAALSSHAGVPDSRALSCAVHASAEYGVPYSIIYGILTVEGGKVGTVSKNTNGTQDFGPMQVNSLWLKKLSPYGITQHHLVNDACVNVRTGTWILANEIRRAGGDLWKGVASYHSRTPSRGHNYARKVWQAITLAVRNSVGGER